MINEHTDVISKSEAERLGKLYPIILEKHNFIWKECEIESRLHNE